MPSYRFLTLDVFTDTAFGGNPLAVFPGAAGLDAARMQAIAGEFNLSETTFVLPPADPAHTAHVRIFGPRQELPFAGHPNVGTGFALAAAMANPPATLIFEEAAGLVRIEPLRDGAGAVIGARVAAPVPLAPGVAIPPETIAACLGLAPDDISRATHAPRIASVGTEFAIAEVNDLAALARATPDLAALRAAAARFPEAPGFKLLVHVATGPGARQLRMFAPLIGVTEDAATGSAAAALAALLLDAEGGTNAEYAFAQGQEIGRPSRIEAAARRAPDGAVHASIAGRCVAMMRGELSL